MSNITVLNKPNNYPVIEKGAYHDAPVTNLLQCESGNEEIASAERLSNYHVRVTGLRAGAVTIAAGTKIGVVMVVNYQIRDSSLIGEYTLENDGKVYFSEPGKRKNIPVTVSPASAKGSISWKSMEKSIADVTSGGEIKALKKGAALILGTFTDKWGVERHIHVLAGVGVLLGDSDLDKLVELIQQAECILSGDTGAYDPEELAALEKALEDGKKVVDSENPSDGDINKAIEDLENAIDGLSKKPGPLPDIANTPDGGVINIDGKDWIKVKKSTFNGKNFALLMLKETIGPWQYHSDSSKIKVQYKESEIFHKVNSWYDGLKAPTLKAIASEADIGTGETETWAEDGTEIYAHLPRKVNTDLVPTALRYIGKSYWLATPAESSGAWVYQRAILASDEYGIALNIQSLYARPIIWVHE